MTRASVAAAAVLLTLPAFAAYSQEHAHPEGAPTEKLGTVHFATSCSPRVAPQFDRAVALLHSFEFGASIRAFNEVLAADSEAKAILDGLPALSARFDPTAITGAAPGSAGVFALAAIPARILPDSLTLWVKRCSADRVRRAADDA